MLERLTVENYKSLRKLNGFPLSPFMAFVGPNNAGKSNILDVFHFLSDLVRHRGGAFQTRESFKDIVWNGDLRHQILIAIEGRGSPAYGFPPELQFVYSLRIGGERLTFARILDEKFSVRLDPHSHGFLDMEYESIGTSKDWVDLFCLNKEGKRVYRNVRERLSQTVIPIDGPVFESGLSGIEGYPILSQFARALQGWQFHNFEPSAMRDLNAAKKQVDVGSRGELLASALHTVQSENDTGFREIRELLQSVIPEIEDIRTHLTEGGQTYVGLREKSIEIPVKSWMMSTGTLRLLAHLCAVYTEPRPALCAFEEPENFIHPHLVKMIAEVLQRASKRSQILISTHSPYLLDALTPEDVVVVEKTEGSTNVQRASGKTGVLEAKKKLGMGELWYSGHLGGIP
jgi:predicted ATPase